MNNDDKAIERANSMKMFPNKEVTTSDFSLDKIDWENGRYLPWDLTRLYRYKCDLMWESVIHTISTGERIPPQVWCYDRISKELSVDKDELRYLLFAGEQMDHFEYITQMDDDELNEYITDYYDSETLVPDEIQQVVDYAVSKCNTRRSEIDMLNKMWGDGQ